MNIIKGVRNLINKWFAKEHRGHILDLIPEGSVCAEIGVWRGDFSKKMLKRKPAKLHLIDPWLYIPDYKDRIYGNTNNNNQERMDRIYQAVCDEFAKSPAVIIHRTMSDVAVNEFPNDYFDLIYIDGNHSYEYVKNDIELYLPKMKVGTYVTGDDYLFDRCPNGGPKRAVDEIVAEGKVRLISIINNQFILQKI
ncbi:MAG: class I SAM-dependent methyltransferase [Candidatus Promineifilaceae bacterium]|nr:class I SAM-dependent methyltransferase [Candidatus Promineifilaceae bacterium]